MDVKQELTVELGPDAPDIAVRVTAINLALSYEDPLEAIDDIYNFLRESPSLSKPHRDIEACTADERESPTPIPRKRVPDRDRYKVEDADDPQFAEFQDRLQAIEQMLQKLGGDIACELQRRGDDQALAGDFLIKSTNATNPLWRLIRQTPPPMEVRQQLPRAQCRHNRVGDVIGSGYELDESSNASGSKSRH